MLPAPIRTPTLYLLIHRPSALENGGSISSPEPQACKIRREMKASFSPAARRPPLSADAWPANNCCRSMTTDDLLPAGALMLGGIHDM
jgi:hypothetical protein